MLYLRPVDNGASELTAGSGRSREQRNEWPVSMLQSTTTPTHLRDDHIPCRPLLGPQMLR